MTLTSNNLETCTTSDRNERSISLDDNELLEVVNSDHKTNNTMSSNNSNLTRIMDTTFGNNILNKSIYPINDDLRKPMFLNYDQCNRAISPIKNFFKAPITRNNNDNIRSMSSSNSNMKKLISANNKEISKINLFNNDINKSTVLINEKGKNSIKTKITKSNKPSVTISPTISRKKNELNNLTTLKKKQQNYLSNKNCIPQYSGNKRLENNCKLKKSGGSHDYYHTYNSSKDSIREKNIISSMYTVLKFHNVYPN